jgi:RHS repeat-associated protein
VTDNAGNQIGTTVKYLPFGETRLGSVPTNKLFTGQRLDGTGLYYYNARYYDPTIGRFISPDTMIQNPANPQCFNRYSYCLNNPLKYTDPSGHWEWLLGLAAVTAWIPVVGEIVCVVTITDSRGNFRASYRDFTLSDGKIVRLITTMFSYGVE